jgi:hypothetical protein
VIGSAGIGDIPKPGRSSATTRRRWAKRGMFSSQFCHWPLSPWTKTIGLSSPCSPMSA